MLEVRLKIKLLLFQIAMISCQNASLFVYLPIWRWCITLLIPLMNKESVYHSQFPPVPADRGEIESSYLMTCSLSSGALYFRHERLFLQLEQFICIIDQCCGLCV